MADELESVCSTLKPLRIPGQSLPEQVGFSLRIDELESIEARALLVLHTKPAWLDDRLRIELQVLVKSARGVAMAIDSRSEDRCIDVEADDVLALLRGL